MPTGKVKRTEIVSKIAFEEDPALAGFRGSDEALRGFLAQHGRRHAQETGGFGQVIGTLPLSHGRSPEIGPSRFFQRGPGTDRGMARVGRQNCIAFRSARARALSSNGMPASMT